MRTVVVAAAVVLAACTSDEPISSPSVAGQPRSAQTSTPTESGSVTQEVRVSRDTRRGPEACHPENVGSLVVDFFGAVNRGEAHRVTDFFTRELGWYSVTEGNPRNGGRHFVAYKPSRLQTYFVGRVSHDERMYLIEIDVAYERAGDLAHVAYGLLRSADDLTKYAAEAAGKGAIDCESGRITVWSMAQGPESQPIGGLCPGKPDPPHTAIACARA
jgi:hypothetical protein